MRDIGLEVGLGFFIILTIFYFIAFEYERNKADQAQLLVNNYKDQIMQLQLDAVKAQAQLNDAWLAASDAVKESNAKSKEILNQKVPKNCNKAIKWAIAQAKTL